MPTRSLSRATLAPAIRSAAVPTIARNIKDAIRYMRSRAALVQVDDAAKRFAKTLLSSGRARDIERLLGLSIDAIDRGAALETAELPWRLGLAAVRQYATKSAVVGSIGELTELECIAQGRLELAECRYRNDPSNPLLARAYVEARSDYFRDSAPLNEQAERMAATGS